MIRVVVALVWLLSLCAGQEAQAETQFMLMADASQELGELKTRLAELESHTKIASMNDRVNGGMRETRKYDFPFEVKHAWIIATDNMAKADKMMILGISGRTVEAEVGAIGQGGMVTFTVWATGF